MLHEDYVPVNRWTNSRRMNQMRTILESGGRQEGKLVPSLSALMSDTEVLKALDMTVIDDMPIVGS